MNTCAACAKPISGSVESCPHCGISLHGYGGAGGSGAGGRKLSTLPVVFIAAGSAFAVLLVCGGIVVALLYPAVSTPREVPRRSQCKNNLKQIGLALHNYHDVYGSFPPAHVDDASGMPVHSWRVLLLPFLNEQPLYSQYDFSEPWDGPNNSRLLDRMPAVYACPSHAAAPGNTHTSYVAPLGAHCIFCGAEPIKISDVLDGLSNTLMVGESTGAKIPWMKPEDIDIAVHASLGDSAGFSSDHTGGVQFLLGDGAVRFISATIAPETLTALFSRDGGEVVGDF